MRKTRAKDKCIDCRVTRVDVTLMSECDCDGKLQKVFPGPEAQGGRWPRLSALWTSGGPCFFFVGRRDFRAHEQQRQ